MSIRIRLTNPQDEIRLKEQLTVVTNEKTRVCFVEGVFPYFNVPFSYSLARRETKAPLLSKTCPTFTGKLRPEQVNIFQNARKMLMDNHVVMISCYPGFGKTVTTLALACSLGMPVIVVCHRVCLFEQWKLSVEQFCSPCRVVKLPDDNGLPFDFAIVNIANLGKLENLPKDYVLVTDEAHLLLSEKRSLNLLKLFPRRLIGLTATPYRPDELHVLFKYFYGTNFIVKKLHKIHDIYTVHTGIVMKEKRIYGKIDWNYMLEQQSDNIDRHAMIVDIINLFPETRTWLVLVKRKSHGQALHDLLIQKKNRIVSLLIGNVHRYDVNCNVLIGTVGKIGTGFDFPKLDSLMVAADMVQYYIQFLGRVMRTTNVPVVVDLVDSHPIMLHHYNERRKEYLQHGGRMINTPLKEMKNVTQ
jgi:superfamily II DNA or RNA helicase